MQMSNYEHAQAEQFIQEMYDVYGSGLDKKECIGESWVAHVEVKHEYSKNLFREDYWNLVERKIQRKIETLRDNRNKRIKIENKFSLNKRIGENLEDVWTWLPVAKGDFVKGIILWDYIKGLGNTKYLILRLLVRGEEDYFIIRKLNLDMVSYHKIKNELKSDFKEYCFI